MEVCLPSFMVLQEARTRCCGQGPQGLVGHLLWISRDRPAGLAFPAVGTLRAHRP